jgi:acetoin utilization deacetylase AcuC-like enzyme
MPVRKTGVHIDELYLRHVMPPGHPERGDRIRRLLDHRPLFELAGVLRVKAGRAATDEELARVHDREYIERIASTAGKPNVMLDPDTHTSEFSYDTALHAAGGVVEMIDSVMSGNVDNGVVLVRPPGHHAEAGRAMGFCLFNNIAIGARHLTELHRLDRVLIVDWDVHHGNGTQRSFYDDRRVLYLSIHRHPYYPGTGSMHESGHGDGEGFTVNIPLPAGCGDAEYLAAFHEIVHPVAMQYRPQFVLVSAGFDAHGNDPLGGMRVTESGYAAMTSILMGAARDCSEGKIVAVLEGGYDLEALASSVEAMVGVMCGAESAFEGADDKPGGTPPIDSLLPIRQIHSEHWDL